MNFWLGNNIFHLHSKCPATEKYVRPSYDGRRLSSSSLEIYPFMALRPPSWSLIMITCFSMLVKFMATTQDTLLKETLINLKYGQILQNNLSLLQQLICEKISHLLKKTLAFLCSLSRLSITYYQNNKWIYLILKECIIEIIRFLPLFLFFSFFGFSFIHLHCNQNFLCHAELTRNQYVNLAYQLAF